MSDEQKPAPGPAPTQDPAPGPAGKEARQQERRRVRWRALILHPDWHNDQTHIINVSESGACIVSPDSRAVGSPMRIVLFVPDLKQSGKVMPYMLSARVAYSVLSADGFQLGLQFHKPDSAAVAHIASAMRR